MKYRIIEERTNNTLIRFISEYRYKFIPIWFRFTTTYTGYDFSDLAFSELLLAEKYIRDLNKLDEIELITHLI